MRDSDFIQITDAALASAYGRAGTGSGRASGEWMACHPGCDPCCHGVFAITSLDAARLREALALTPPEIRTAIDKRAEASRARLTPDFPGDPATGILFTEPHHEEAFDDFANDEPCPVLDPVARTCQLYAARPIPCRTFGPPMPNDPHEPGTQGFAVCELCFINAPPEEVARCAVEASFLTLESEAVAAYEGTSTERGPTLIAFALTKR